MRSALGIALMVFFLFWHMSFPAASLSLPSSYGEDHKAVLSVRLLAGVHPAQLQLQETIASVQAVVGKEHRRPSEETVSRAWDVVLARMDIEGMARRILWRHWVRLSENERGRFRAIFADFMRRVFAKYIDFVKGAEIAYRHVAAYGAEAVVSIAVTPSGQFTQEIEIYLHRVHDSWMIYDVGVGGITLVRVYRSQLTTILEQGSFDALLAEIEKKAKN